MVAIAKQLQGHKRQLQHKVTTGTKLVMGLDGRTSDARRFRDICAGLIEELGREPTQSELLLVRQASTATVALERLQAKTIMGQLTPVELTEVSRLANVANRTMARLKLKPRGSNAGLDLTAYLAGRGKADTA